MHQLHVISFGQRLQPWIQEGLDHYQKGVFSPFKLTFSRYKTWDERKISSQAILLDPLGKLCHSDDFYQLVVGKYVEKGVPCELVIGPDEGFSSEIRKTHSLVSLSPMTFPHQLALLILMEQLYRICHRYHHIPYHR